MTLKKSCPFLWGRLILVEKLTNLQISDANSSSRLTKPSSLIRCRRRNRDTPDSIVNNWTQFNIPGKGSNFFIKNAGIK